MNDKKKHNFVSVNLLDIRLDEPLPVSVHLFVDGRFLLLRAEGDSIPQEVFDRLVYKHVQFVFVDEAVKPKLLAWISKAENLERKAILESPDTIRSLLESKHEAKRRMLDLFSKSKLDEAGKEALSVSKELTGKLMGRSYAVESLSYLQSFSRGAVDHSVNVSMLAIYLALRMGFDNPVVLENLGAGALLHDIGKFQVWMEATQNSETLDEPEEILKQHSILGAQFLMAEGEVPREVITLIAQHHEYYDGSGYPQGMKGNEIFELAKILTIANEFDAAVFRQDRLLDIKDRQRNALKWMLSEKERKKYDPIQLEKVERILSAGI